MEYPDGDLRGSCAYCLKGRCSTTKDSYPFRGELQAWLNGNAGQQTSIRSKQNNLNSAPAVSTAPNDDLNVKSATSVAQSSKNTAINNNVPEAPSIDTLPAPSVQTVKLQATIPPTPFSISADQSAPQVEGNSTASSSKRSRSNSDPGLDTSEMAPAKAARHHNSTISDAMLIEEALKGTREDAHFGNLVLGLVKHHETILKSRNAATITTEEQKAKLEKNEAIIQVHENEKVELEANKVASVMERNAAAVQAGEQMKKHTMQLEKAEILIKSLEDQKAEWEKERAGLLKSVAAMRNREKEMDFENRYAKLVDKNRKTEVMLEDTQKCLKRAMASMGASQARVQKEEVDRKEGEKVREQKEIEEKSRAEAMEKEKEAMRGRIKGLEIQLLEEAKETIAMKDKMGKEDEATRVKMNQLEDQLVEMEKGKKTMSNSMKGMEVRLEEMENLRSRNISAVQSANACRAERKQAQASLAIAQEDKIRITTKMERTQAAFNVAAATIQKHQTEITRLIQKESDTRVTVKPKLANLQANHHQLETDKKRLDTEVLQAKQRIMDLEANLQVSQASLMDHVSIEKDLVASKILATNYREQRDEARSNLLKSDKAKTDIKRNSNLKSAEMSRLHAEIRRLKGEVRKSEGSRADSGSIGEVEGLIDISMED